jgi:hypothetical protein
MLEAERAYTYMCVYLTGRRYPMLPVSFAWPVVASFGQSHLLRGQTCSLSELSGRKQKILCSGNKRERLTQSRLQGTVEMTNIGSGAQTKARKATSVVAQLTPIVVRRFDI